MRKENKKGQLSMGALLAAFLILIVGLVLSPAIGDLGTDGPCSGANCTGTDKNITGVAGVLFNLIPLFWVIFILGIVAVIGVTQFKKIQ